ncbi:MAG: hypothetical protein C0598_02710, partial [Marinilabiliales bacterium]
MKYTFTLFFAICISLSSIAQINIQTTAESSNYTKTSTYEEMRDFVKKLDDSSDILRIEKIAESTEGRDIITLIVANPMINSYKDAINDKRVIVYIQANIHAGEVEGKESTQMLARHLVNN